MLVYENELIIREISPNFAALKGLKDIIVTSPSSDKKYDFISRLFTPSDAILEDPGQVGELYLTLKEDCLEICAEAITVLAGTLKVPPSTNHILL